ncbi:DsbA family protein [Leeia sp.]|uniref:DsbA family protein n=1 Tax=Leeia sp. TaxID=2884678 RepID=UPI0035AFA191
MATLHYFLDPFCGWCYGAAPLIKAARQHLPMVLHAGGMMMGAQRQPVTPALRDFVLSHDDRIAALTGQPFSAAYRDGLLQDPHAVFDSEPPTTALLAADSLGGRGLDLLAQLQYAHFVEGRRIADPEVLREQAVQIGLLEADFVHAWQAQSGDPTLSHVAASRQQLARAGGRGFPTLVLEQEGQWQRIELSPFMGKGDAWSAWLAERFPLPAGEPGLLCDADQCLPR